MGKSFKKTLIILTNGKLNNTVLRQRLDPLYKNILWRQNPYKLVFQNISTFGYPNPTIGILLSKIESLKISEEKINDLLKKTPDPKTIKTENG